MDTRFTWAAHNIIGLQTKLRLRIKQLNYLLRSHAPLHIKRLLYTSIIEPLWTYGCSIWGSASNTNIQKIQVIQNMVCQKWHPTFRLKTIICIGRTAEDIFKIIWHFPAAHHPTHQQLSKETETETPHWSSSLKYCLKTCYLTVPYPHVSSHSCIYFAFFITLDSVLLTQKVSL